MSEELVSLTLGSSQSPSKPFRHKQSNSLKFSKAVDFSSLKKSDDEISHLPAALANFYTHQNEAIDDYLTMDHLGQETEENRQAQNDLDVENRKYANYAVNVSFAANCILCLSFMTIAITTGSIAVIASTIDSALDIVSAGVFLFTARAIKNVDPYKFPASKSRLEPLGIVVFSGLMASAALQIIVQALQGLIDGIRGNISAVQFSGVSIGVLAGAIGLKLVLFIVCTLVGKLASFPLVETLAKDHINDVFINSITSSCGAIASFVPSLWFIDPIGGVLLACLILRSWIRTGKEQISLLIGRTAEPSFLSKLSYISAHHPGVELVDTVRAFHFGPRFLVEIDIVLPEDMPLKEAHDIGEGLENKIESLDEVERAYVHLDYETLHKPERTAGFGNRYDAK